LSQAERNPPAAGLPVHPEDASAKRSKGLRSWILRLQFFPLPAQPASWEFNEHAAEIVALRDPALQSWAAPLRFLSA